MACSRHPLNAWGNCIKLQVKPVWLVLGHQATRPKSSNDFSTRGILSEMPHFKMQLERRGGGGGGGGRWQ